MTEFSSTIADLDTLASNAARGAQKMFRLTGQHDPVLENVRIQLANGEWKSLGNVRLSDIGHWNVRA